MDEIEVPTEAEIRAACLSIQATWSDRERLSRLHASSSPVDCRPSVRLRAEDRVQERLERERAG